LIEQIVEEREDSLCRTRGWHHERHKLSSFPIVPQVNIATAAVVSTSTISAALVALRIFCKFFIKTEKVLVVPGENRCIICFVVKFFDNIENLLMIRTPSCLEFINNVYTAIFFFFFLLIQ